MFKNVLVGVDGSPNGRDAIVLATRLAVPAGKLTLAHVHSGELRPTRAVTPGLLREERRASQELLEHERASAGVSAELISVVSLSAGRGLHQQAEEQNADLLVVGSCGRGVFGRTMLGDDTRAALNGAPCAVAIASRGYAQDPAIAKVGVGYNGSSESEAAIVAARELAARTGASVHALEVISIPTVAFSGIMPTVIGDSVELMLEDATNRMAKLPGLEGRAVYGLTGEELAAFSGQMDLLVVGSRGFGPVRRLVLGTTSEYLERHARCSLLVLPRTAASAISEGEHRAETPSVAV